MDTEATYFTDLRYKIIALCVQPFTQSISDKEACKGNSLAVLYKQSLPTTTLCMINNIIEPAVL